MKRILLIAPLALAACNPPVNDNPAAFETIDATLVEEAGCRFMPIDGAGDQLLFATYAGNPDFMAVSKIKGETLKLVPKEPQQMDTDTFDITYEVVDYLKWQVRAQATDGVGELVLINRGEPTETRIAMRGSCAG